MFTEKIKSLFDWFEWKSGLKIPTLHPESTTFIIWEALIVIVNFYNAFFVPFRIGFETGYRGIWLVFDLLGDLLLIADIFLRFHVGYMEMGEYVDDKDKIMQIYRHGSMKRHLAASFPLDILARLVMPGASPVLLGFLRLPRLLRINESFSVFSRWEDKARINPFIIRMLSLAVLIFFFTHWIACAWFFIGKLGIYLASESWLSESLLDEAPTARRYLVTFYWVLSVLTIGESGDLDLAIQPTTPIEGAFTLLVVFLGVSMFAYIIGNVSSLVLSLDSAQTKYREKLDQLRVYLRRNQVPQTLQEEIVDYYQYRWQVNRDTDEMDVVEELPGSLKAKVYLHLHKEIIEKVPLFEGASSQLIEDIVMALQSEILPPNTYVIQEGHLGHEMYFLQRGEVQAFSQKTGKIYRNMGAGSFFGEIALVYSSRRTAAIKTLSYCEVFVLYKQDFDKVLANYPEFAEEVKRIAAERYKVS
jgi:hypothetical protein